jgi:pyridinium-3,5-biscarboxylic acid mononucleotide sulfurtransferase
VIDRPVGSQAAPVRASVRMSGPGLGREIAAKRERLEGILGSLGRTLVAYSGGVDSTLLLIEAHRALGPGALGVIAESPSLPRSELSAALEAATAWGVQVRVIETHEMRREGYRKNGPDRCYHCKSELFEELIEIAREEGWESICYGAITDDLGDDRPGMTAAKELRIRAPLLEAGLNKLEVRILAREIGIRVWDKPQSACLSSRIPHGSEVTPEKLAQVERGETWLREAFSLRVVRLRHEGARARIEVSSTQIPLLSRPESIGRIREVLSGLGFREVVIDPAGYRRPDPQPF